jgi:hypothetical protein
MTSLERLMQAGYDFAIEIRDGKWDHVSDPHDLPARGWPGLVAELQRRCPGFSDAQYSHAIGNGLFNSR